MINEIFGTQVIQNDCNHFAKIKCRSDKRQFRISGQLFTHKLRNHRFYTTSDYYTITTGIISQQMELFQGLQNVT